MKPRLSQLHQSGATANQLALWDNAAGYWKPYTLTSTKGDLLGYDTAPNRIPVGTNGQVLTADSTQTLGLKWATPSGGGSSPLTTKGDLYGYDTAGNRIPVGTNGQVLTADSTQTLGLKWATPSGGGTTINDRRWVRGSTANALDDEFNSGSLSGSWSRVDNTGRTGGATWTVAGDSLSVKLNGGDAAGELHGLVQSYAMAVGDTIQCHIMGRGPSSNYPFAGLIVADGNTYGSGQQITHQLWVATSAFDDMVEANWSGWNTRTAFSDSTYQGYGLDLHIKILRDTSNVWRHYVSPDAISWVELANARTLSMTPAYVGFAAGSWTSSTPFVFAFDYFRVNA